MTKKTLKNKSKNDIINIQELDILFISLSSRWSTIERTALKDAKYLRSLGGKPTIFCLHNSMLAKMAEKESLESYHIKRSKFSRSLNFSFLKEFYKLIYQKKYDAIHVYQLDITLAVAFFLKRNKRTVLFSTLNQSIKRGYKGLFFKWLLKRVDKIFSFSDDMTSYLYECFSLNKRKFSTIGHGSDPLNVGDKKGPQKNIIGSYIQNYPDLGQLAMLISIFRDLKNYSADEYEGLQLNIFVGKRVFGTRKLKKVLTGLDHEFYQGDIFIHPLEDKDTIKEMNILFSVCSAEPMNDLEMQCIIEGVPVLFPRTIGRQGLLYRYGKIGDSYAKEDKREARSKLYYMLKYHHNYSKVLNKRKEVLIEDHGNQKYQERLKAFYERSLALRRRYHLKSKRRESSPS